MEPDKNLSATKWSGRAAGIFRLFPPYVLRFTNFASLLILFFLIIGSCDIVEPPFIEKPTDGGDSTSNPRRVLLLDFTGHTCKSCPKAHQTIDQLKALYGERLIPVAFHLGYFSKPLTSGKFTTDFRTPEGALLEKHFEFVSFPTGTVQTLGSGELQPYASWPALVANALKGDAPLEMQLSVEYISGLHALTATLDVTALEPVDGQVNVAVYLVESGITDWQKDEDLDPMDVPDYVHNHVFRTSLGGVWGEPIAEGPMSGGQLVSREFSLVMDSVWSATNCTLVAFTYRTGTYEIIQAVEQELIK